MIGKMKIDGLKFSGLHCHLGSTIKDVGLFKQAVNDIRNLLLVISETIDLSGVLINLGGGLGIDYHRCEHTCIGNLTPASILVIFLT